MYLRDASVVEDFLGLDILVFDKTGTLTESVSKEVHFAGDALSAAEKRLISSAVAGSIHPASRMIRAYCQEKEDLSVEAYQELPGKGIVATVAGVDVQVGSASYLKINAAEKVEAGRVYVKIGDKLRGAFVFDSVYREGLATVIDDLKDYDMAVLSGDNEKDKELLGTFFPENTTMRFSQSPGDKLKVIGQLQEEGHKVLMLGDGLNDAGALKQSDIGLAVTDDVSAFSPASKGIIHGEALPKLNRILAFLQSGKKVIAASFGLSFLYNVVGISLAVTGVFTPLVAAILMPLSSISVVFLTTSMVQVLSKKHKLN